MSRKNVVWIVWRLLADGQAETEPSPSSATSSASVDAACSIKGNISSKKEKIYHVEGCGSYAKTTIDKSAGERWFGTEPEARAAGWRKAANCP